MECAKVGRRLISLRLIHLLIAFRVLQLHKSTYFDWDTAADGIVSSWRLWSGRSLLSRNQNHRFEQRRVPCDTERGNESENAVLCILQRCTASRLSITESNVRESDEFGIGRLHNNIQSRRRSFLKFTFGLWRRKVYHSPTR